MRYQKSVYLSSFNIFLYNGDIRLNALSEIGLLIVIRFVGCFVFLKKGDEQNRRR